MELNQILYVGLQDVAQAFGIQDDLFQLYGKEVSENQALIDLAKARQDLQDWKSEFPLGGPGTFLNALVLYCLIRHAKILSVIETGVSGGFYTAFMLAALKKNKEENDTGLPVLTSLEISDNKEEVAKLVPSEFRSARESGVHWDLLLGKSSLDRFKEMLNHSAELYSHDSLHTMSHMLKELMEFKKSKRDVFYVFIDDQDSDNFWAKCISSGAFNKPGFKVSMIDGRSSRLKGHLGGFIKYEKV